MTSYWQNILFWKCFSLTPIVLLCCCWSPICAGFQVVSGWVLPIKFQWAISCRNWTGKANHSKCDNKVSLFSPFGWKSQIFESNGRQWHNTKCEQVNKVWTPLSVVTHESMCYYIHFSISNLMKDIDFNICAADNSFLEIPKTNVAMEDQCCNCEGVHVYCH